MRSNAQVVRCGQCELIQYATAVCRRCGKDLPVIPPPIIETVTVTKYIRIPVVLGELFPETLPTADEWGLMLLREAVKRAGNPHLAAKMIGIGKTTAYRWLGGSKKESATR